jgi:hypothetical protein
MTKRREEEDMIWGKNREDVNSKMNEKNEKKNKNE